MIKLGIVVAESGLAVGDVVATVATTKSVGEKVATLLPLTAEQTLYCDWPGYGGVSYPGKTFRELGEKMGANRVMAEGNYLASVPNLNFLLCSVDRLFYLDFAGGGVSSKKSLNGGNSWTVVSIALPATDAPIFHNGRSKISYITFSVTEGGSAQRVYTLYINSVAVKKGRLLNPDGTTLLDAKVAINNSMGFALYDNAGVKVLTFSDFTWTDSDGQSVYNLNVPAGDWEGLDPLSGSVSEACVLWSGTQVAFPEVVVQNGFQVTVTWKVYDIAALGGSVDEYIVDVTQPTGNVGGNVYLTTNKRVLLFKKSDNYTTFSLVPGTDKLRGDINYCVPDNSYGVDFIYSSDANGQYLYYSVLSSRTAEYPADHTWYELTPPGDVWDGTYLTMPTLTAKSGLSRPVPGAVMQDGTVWRASSSHLAGNPAFPFVVPAYPDAGTFAKLIVEIA